LHTGISGQLVFSKNSCASYDTKVHGVGNTWKGLKEFTPLIFRRKLSAR